MNMILLALDLSGVHAQYALWCLTPHDLLIHLIDRGGLYVDRAVVNEELCGGDVVVVVAGDFEVVDGEDPLGAGDAGDGSGGVVALGEVVADVQVAGEDPAFAVDVEGVFFGDDDLGAVADGDGFQGGGLLLNRPTTSRSSLVPVSRSRAHTWSPTWICSMGTGPWSVSTRVPAMKQLQPLDRMRSAARPTRDSATAARAVLTAPVTARPILLAYWTALTAALAARPAPMSWAVAVMAISVAFSVLPVAR